MTFRLFTIAAAALAAFGACAAEMETATPESQGVSSRAILRWIDECEKTFDGLGQIGALHGFVIVRNGKTIAEGSWKPFNTLEETHMLHSHSKSFTSIAVGFLVQEGKLDIDEYVTAIFPECLPGKVSRNLSLLRVRDLLTMTTGVVKSHRIADFPDWVHAFFRREYVNRPGTAFKYDSDATYLLAAIVEKRSGEKLMDYLDRRLFSKIGIKKAWSTHSPQGIACGGWGMNMTTREIARFGLCCLQGGRWGGESVIHPQWIQLATARQTASGWRNVGIKALGEGDDWEQGYGFQFWRCRDNGYRADGAAGQLTLVYPDKNLVVSIHAGVDNMKLEIDLVREHLLAAMQDAPLPEDDEARALLGRKLKSLEIAPLKGGIDGIEKYLGHEIPVAENSRGIKSVEIRLREGERTPRFVFRVKDRTNDVPVGIGTWAQGVVRIDDQNTETLGALIGEQKVMTSGAMQKDGSFKVRTYLTGTTAYIEAVFGEKGGRLVLDGVLWGMRGVRFKNRATAYDVTLDTSPDRVKSPLKVDMPRVGTLRPRSTKEIKSSNWTIGCETLDRDFAKFDEYKEFLPPLGCKTIRLQCGWHKCEKVRGVYDFAWLDAPVDFALANGMNVIMETSYGNRLYPGGGGEDLSGGFPTSEEALAAWDRWVDALTRHFKGRVRDYKVWNEPDNMPLDGSKKKTMEEIAVFNVRTAKIIKRNIPDARIAALCLSCSEPGMMEDCLKVMGKDMELFTWILYHGYKKAPESSYYYVDKMWEVLRRYSSTLSLKQGENGAPSEFAPDFALNGFPWSEYSQAKWNMRRMLGDLGHDVESSVFTIVDYPHKGRFLNTKGLLRADEKCNVIAVKRAYYAVQNVVSVFDRRWTRVKGSKFGDGFGSEDMTLSTYHYVKDSGEPLFVFWTHGKEFVKVREKFIDNGLMMPLKGKYMPFERPGESFETRPATFRWTGAPLKNPVWVDLLTGAVYAFAKENLLKCHNGTYLVNVPVYDSPCFITELSALDIVER